MYQVSWLMMLMIPSRNFVKRFVAKLSGSCQRAGISVLSRGRHVYSWGPLFLLKMQNVYSRVRFISFWKLNVLSVLYLLISWFTPLCSCLKIVPWCVKYWCWETAEMCVWGLKNKKTKTKHERDLNLNFTFTTQ